MLRRLMCLLGCLMLVFAPALSLAQEETAHFTMAGFDGQDSTHDWSTNGFFTRMNERTGISFEFQQYNDLAQWKAAKQKMFSSGELPDVLFKAALNTQELIAYSESEQLIDLLPLLPEYAPNLWAVLQEHPDWLAAITLPSGKVVALPDIQPYASQNALWINKTWLDKLGLSVPTDFASLREVLTAFQTKDPNQNGKADEIPLTYLGPWELKFFSHAYGVAANDYNIYMDDAGKVHYWPDEDSFFELIETLRGLYADGLIDKDGFYTADALRRITDDKAVVTYGAFFAPTPVNLVTYTQAADFVLVEPFVYEGKQIYRDLVGNVTRGTFAITSACKDPKAILGWVDTLYSEEGAIEAMVGKQDVDYVISEDGYWQWKGGIDSMTTTKLSELSVYDSGSMPWLFPEGFYERYAEADVRRISEELKKLSPYIVKPFPVYTLTAAQSAEVMAIQNELGTYVDESFARFIIGQEKLNDDTIAVFREKIRELGMERMVAFWQGVAEGAAEGADRK